jgi:hypothetical protein
MLALVKRARKMAGVALCCSDLGARPNQHFCSIRRQGDRSFLIADSPRTKYYCFTCQGGQDDATEKLAQVF